MRDEGPSRDAARLIHERLTESLGIPKGEVIPGNYFVLRNMPCGAVLAEPSYLSNPRVEEKLRLAEKQLLEAQAYFLGILEYFRRGVPQIASLSPCDTVLTDAQPTLIATFSVERSPIDASSVLVTLDGAAISRSLGTGNEQVKTRPEKPLANGRHEFCVSCRNVNGNSSGEHCCHFEVSLPPFSLVAKAWPDCVPGSGGVLVTAEVKDVNGNSVKDGTLVEFSGQVGAFSTDSVATLGGVATNVFFPDSSYGEKPIRVSHRGLRDSLSLGDSLVLESCGAAAPVTTQALRVVAGDTGEPLADARLWLWNRDSLRASSSPQGLMVFTIDPREGSFLTKSGFIPTPVLMTVTVAPGHGPGPARSETVSVSTGTRDLMTVKMEAAASGLFRNTKVVVDIGRAPEYEGRTQPGSRTSDPEETGSGKTRLNTRVVERLKEILIGAGAQVLVLGETLSDEEKVRVAELFGAQLYLRLELSSQRSASMIHYPGSNPGKKLAEEMARAWHMMLSEKEPSIKEGAQYVIRQTSCPALIAMLPSSAKGGDERYSSTVAYALFLGILEDRGLKNDQLAELTVNAVNSVQNERLEVTLDEFISLPVVAGETVTFFCEEGTHLVRIRSPEGKSALRFVTLRKGEQARLDFELGQSVADTSSTWSNH
jgi:N-acetylmuramoyl-L-alanine amidase